MIKVKEINTKVSSISTEDFGMQGAIDFCGTIKFKCSKSKDFDKIVSWANGNEDMFLEIVSKYLKIN